MSEENPPTEDGANAAPENSTNPVNGENNNPYTALPGETIFRNLYTPKILPPFDTGEDSRATSTDVLNTTIQNLEAIQFIPDLTPVGYRKRVEYAFDELHEERDREKASHDDPYRDVNFFLEVAISTIILMAAGSSDIPVSNYMYTEHYLNSIKTDFGEHPPNISGFLSQLRYRKKEEKIDYGRRHRFKPPPDMFLVRTPKHPPHVINLDRTVHTLNNTTLLDKTKTEAEPELEKTKAETPAETTKDVPEITVDAPPEEEEFHDAED